MMVVVCAAGESKLKKATEKKTRIIDEDGLFAIIKASGPPSAASSAGGANGGAAAAKKPEPTLKKGCSFAQQEGCSFAQLQCAGPQCAQACQGLLPPPNTARARHAVSREDAHRAGGAGACTHARGQGPLVLCPRPRSGCAAGGHA